MVNKKVKNTIPVYNIEAIGGTDQLPGTLIVERFADYLKVHPNLHAPHKHDFYHIVLFTKGKGKHTIDFQQFEVKANSIYFMIPGQVHSWSFTGEVDGYIINFSSELLYAFLYNRQYLDQFSFFKGIAQDSVLTLGKATTLALSTIVEAMIAEVRGKAALQKEMICSLLTQLLVGVHRDTVAKLSTAQPMQGQVLLSGFRKMVEEHYTVKHLPKDYAAMLYITPNYLNGLCKDMLGKTAGEVIRDRILLEAKRLLVNAELNVEAISDALSFTDNSYFTKFFKKYTSLTPEAFRKRAVANDLK